MLRLVVVLALASACGGGKGASMDAATDAASVDASFDTATDGAVQGGACATTLGLPAAPVLHPGGSATRMVMADVTGDGQADIVIAAGYVVQMAAGRGDGTFASFKTLVSNFQTGGHQAVTVGDATGDGVPDIAYSVFTNNTSIFTLVNMGNGTFSSGAAYDMGIIPSAVAVVDLNGDAKPDLLAFDTQSSTIAVRIAGAAGFGNVVPSSTATPAPVKMVLADVNGDARPDAVIASAASTSPGVWIALNNGNGTFAAATLHATSAPTWGVAVGDIDNDGDTDVVATGYNAPSVFAFLNQGAGSFGAAQTTSTGKQLVTGMPTLGDVDGDSKLDLVVADGASGGYQLLLLLPGLGSGLFDTPVDYPEDGNSLSAELVDTNNDGKRDLVVAKNTMVATWLNNGTSQHFEMRSAFQYATDASDRTARFIDANADGKADLVTAYVQGTSMLSGGIGLRLQQATGQFGAATTYPLEGLPSSSLKADIDHDGHPDLIVFVANNSGLLAQVVLDHGTSTLDVLPGMAVSPLLSTSPKQSVTGDFNEDGKLDLLVGIAAGVVLYPGNGDGTFAAGTVVWDGTGKTLWGVTAGDVDGDGHADLLVELTTSIEGGLDVMLGTGTGTFGPAMFTTVGYLGHLALRDLNKDGHLDLVDYTGNAGVGVQLGSGTGTFGARTNLAGPSSGEADFGDLNGDGNVDIVIEAGLDQNLNLLLGDGAGSFAPAISYEAGSGLRSLDLLDADGDGHLDIAVDNVHSSSILFGRCLP